MSQLSHAQFPLRRHPNLLVDHRRSRSAAVAEPRGANGEAVTGSGGRLHFGMVAGIKSERWPTSNRNPRPDCLGIRIGRLAVDSTAQGRGLGGSLLLRAAHRCIRVADDVGGVALLIDAKNDRAARWYQSYGALALDDAPLSLVLPLATAADAIKRGI